MDLVIYEERVEWECKADRKEAANRRTATNQKKPLQLRVGLREQYLARKNRGGQEPEELLGENGLGTYST